MLARRNWLLRTSILINAVVLLYFASYFTTSKNGGLDWVESLQLQQLQQQQLSSPGKNSAEVDQDPNKDVSSPVVISSSEEQSQQPQQQQPSINGQPAQGMVEVIGVNAEALISEQQGLVQQPSVNTVIQGTTANAQSKTTRMSTTLKAAEPESIAGSIIAATPETTEPTSLKDIIQCHDKDNRYRIGQKGDFWILYNYVLPNRTFHCYETITYTTHADYTFIDNLEPLLERWLGPVSLAMYAPGTDFMPTLNTIRYLRKCGSPLVSEYVTFHIYFGSKHIPKAVPKPEAIFSNHINCSLPPPWFNVSSSTLYKTQKKLLYPVNVGRNIARDTATTHYILASDIELYPSPGLIPDFMDMIRRQDPPLSHKRPKVFPLALFEVEANLNPPANKKELVEMLKNRTAIPFHKKVCPGCHNFPKSKEWVMAPMKPGLHVFHIGKRLGYFVHWEPIFIGTHSDPYYDERLSWEGKSDKMTQGYALCVLDYEFQILDNAFLVHKPGIKTLKKDTARAILTGRTNTLIRKVIFPELKVLYGVRKGCAV